MVHVLSLWCVRLSMSSLNDISSSFEGLSPEEVEKKIALLAEEDPKALDQLAKVVKEYRITKAREDPVAFVEYVIRDEETQEPLRLAPYHRKMIEIVGTNRYVSIIGHTESGKSALITLGRVLWEIGRNSSIRCCIIQATESQAEDIVATIKRYIEFSEEFHDVFPHIKRGADWTNSSFSVERPLGIRDPTVIACGLHGNILGRRFDLVVIDDVLTHKNTATEYMREDVYTWLLTTPMSRLTRNARIWSLANAWHVDDASHRFGRMEGWKCYKFPVRHPVTKEPLWPERWPNERIEAFGKTRPPWEVARALDCVPRTAESGRFREQWFLDALERGRGIFGEDPMCYGLQSIPKGCETFTGVDLGISEALGTDLTAIFTVMTHPDGRITVLNCQSGNWDANEIVERIIRAHYQFKSYVFVESVFAQRWILQLVRKRAPNCPVFPFQTRGTGTFRNKRHAHFGVEAVAAELAQGLWIIPCAKTSGSIDPELQAWMAGCMAYDPNSHVSDQLMSCWIALQGARKQTGIVGYAGFVEHNPYVTIDTTPLTDEERRAQRLQDDMFFRQKQADGFWSDVRSELNLPTRTEAELASDLGLNIGIE